MSRRFGIDIDTQVGANKGISLGYATDPSIREEAASGAFVSSFLIYLLESGTVDAAYISKTNIEGEEISAIPYVARTKEEVLDSRTSIYMDFPYFSALDELKDPEIQKVVFVGLPCHFKTLSEIAVKKHWLKEKIFMRIALFCTYSSTRNLISNVLKKEGVNSPEIEKLQFRTGHWRGALTVTKKNGEVIRLPYIPHFGLYMHLFLFTCPRCLSCVDHCGLDADIACGDAWLKELKDHEIKHSIVILRNEKSEGIFNAFCSEGRFHAERASPETVFRAQKRGLIRKVYCVPAFKKLSPLFGFNVKYQGGTLPRWNHYVLAFLLLLNLKIGRSRKITGLIFRLPRCVLYPYVALIKALNSF